MMKLRQAIKRTSTIEMPSYLLLNIRGKVIGLGLGHTSTAIVIELSLTDREGKYNNVSM